MTLKYRMLWFEDDEEVVSEQIGPSLKDYLIELGFQLEIIYQPNGEKLDQLLKDKNYDLIVTDLNLGEHEAGDKLIDLIRQGNVLTEVLLYSANTTPLNNIVKEKGWIERASFCTGLGNLANRMKEIISLTVRKNQDVNNTRGLVIAETILLEKKIENILLHYFDATEEKVLTASKEELLRNIHSKKIEKYETDIEEIKKVNFKEIKSLIDNDILTASNSFDAICSIMKNKIKELNKILNPGKELDEEMRSQLEQKKSELTIIKDELNNFRTEVLKIRNTLAHVTEQIDEEGFPFLETMNKDGNPIRFTNETYIEIRKNLRKHNDNLDGIIKHLI